MSFDKDDFWDIDKLLPKKKSAKPFSTGEKLALHEISGEEKKCDAAERKITLIDRGVPNEETKKYEYNGGFIRSVTIKRYIDRYDFYGNFRKAALVYYDFKTPRCEFSKFYSFMPQYSQFDIKQKNYYFYWRDSVRRGKYIKTDYSYFYLYVYEILNLPDKIPPNDALNLLIDLWRAYRGALPNIDANMSLWVADYCMVYNLPCPTDKISDFIFDVIAAAEFKEFYLGDVVNMGAEGVLSILAYLSDYDWQRGKYAGGDNKEAYSRHMTGAMGALITRLMKNGLLLGDNLEAVTISRSAFRNSLCTHAVKCQLEIEYLPLAKADGVRGIITSAIKYTENKLRALLGVKSRLSVKDFPIEYKNVIDGYFNEIFDRVNKAQRKAAMPEYEKLYEAIDTELSLEGASKIESASWQTTALLVSEEDEIEPLTEEKEAVTQKTENSYGLSRLEISILKALLGEDSEKAMNIARSEGIILDTAVDKINEAFFDNFGDVIIEGGSSNYNIIEDYKEDIGEWILKEAE